MTRYIGIDVHQHSSTAVVLNAAGKRMRTDVLETRAEVLRDFARAIGRPRHICFEEGTQSEWLYELLEPLSDEVAVVQPSKRDGVKSDAYDAQRLADGLRCGTLERRVFKSSGQFTALRQAVRGYDKVTSDVVRTKNRLKAVYRARGLLTGEDIYSPERRDSFLHTLPTHHRTLAQLLSVELDGLRVVQQSAESWLTQEAGRVPIVKRLCTAPGIGTVRASQIVAVVVTPWRFRTKRQFWSYCGLGIVTRSSADWVKNEHGQWVRQHLAQTRGLNRNRHPLLKAVFKGAAHSVLRMPDHRLHQSYVQSLEHTKPTLARLTLARRIAAVVLAMWKNQEDYDPSRHPVTDRSR